MKAERTKDVVAKVKKARAVPTVSAVLRDGSLVETLHQRDEDRTVFCVSDGDKLRIETEILDGGQRLVPYSAKNNLLQHDVVLLPSEALEYDSEEALLDDIRAFIHRYVDLSPRFERIASYYVLLSWVYDAFNELPYLRVRGDAGSGKTRFLLTIGSVCYKPIFASGASTVSPLFRILDAVRGTLIIDEGDFRFSDEKAEIIKILNNGNARGFPVLRSDVSSKGEINPRAYAVFGPKLVATRGYFQDGALESRCLTEEMGQGGLRTDVPISLPPAHKEEASRLRNQLLLFRFRNLEKCGALESVVDRSIEPRLNQIFVPLLSIIQDTEARAELQELARQYNREMIAERGMEVGAQVLEVIRDILAGSPNGQVKIQDLTSWFLDRFGEDYDRKITTRWIGSVVRKKLRLQTRKSHGVFVIPVEERPKVERLYERYGIEPREAGDSNAEKAFDPTDVGAGHEGKLHRPS